MKMAHFPFNVLNWFFKCLREGCYFFWSPGLHLIRGRPKQNTALPVRFVFIDKGQEANLSLR